ncbi:hypothetical protein AeRB84_003202 [Aphanomyces euteiches]|nr:hypothetical protein AeRB84_003202 [Aphanomyces euteiches]
MNICFNRAKSPKEAAPIDEKELFISQFSTKWTDPSTASPSPRIKSSMSVAVFLQKTYDLIESTPADIAEWSNEGRAFVVKKIKEFESQMLPQYFKHSNFASFSRQLRFYGFDKSKKHDIRIVLDASDAESCQGWWEFSNPHFQRDAPEQMVHIRRKTYSEPTTAASSTSSESSEVNQLKRKMSNLQTQLTDLTKQITMLSSVVQAYCQSESMTSSAPSSPVPIKKQKVQVSSPLAVSSPVSISNLDWYDDMVNFDADAEIDSTILDTLLDFPAFPTNLVEL